jgi:hypothetical protein
MWKVRTRKIKCALVLFFFKSIYALLSVVTAEHQVVMLGLSPKETAQAESISEEGVRWRIFGVELMRRWKEQHRQELYTFYFLPNTVT